MGQIFGQAVTAPVLTRMATKTIKFEGSLPDLIRAHPTALTAAQLAELLNLSPKTLFSMAKANRIPVVRIGSLVRFDPGAVASWLESKAA